MTTKHKGRKKSSRENFHVRHPEGRKVYAKNRKDKRKDN